MNSIKIIILLVGSGLLFASPSSAGDLKAINRPLKVGVWDNEPLVFIDNDQRIKGLFPAIVEHIAQKEGWNIHYVSGVFAELKNQLENNEIDMLLSVSVTEARMKQYRFNQEDIFTNWGVVLVKPDSDVKTLSDLENKTIAAMRDAVYTSSRGGIIDLIRTFQINCRIIEKPGYQEAMSAAEHGEAHGAVVNRIVAERVGKRRGLVSSGIVFQPVETRIAFNKTNPIADLAVQAVDRHMRTMRRDAESVYHEAMAVAQGKDIFSPAKIDYFLIFQIVTGCSIVLMLIFLWNRHLKFQIKKHTRALYENQKKFERLYFNAEVGLCRISIKSGRILECNEKLAQIVGCKDREECMAKYVIFEHYAEPNARTKILKILSDKGYIENYPILMTKMDGTQFWMEHSIQSYPDEGFWEIVVIDISPRKIAEQGLKESEQRLQIIFDSAPSAMFLLNEYSEIIKMNSAAREYSGRSESDSINRQTGEGLNCVNAFLNPKGCGSSDDCDGCKIRRAVKETFETNHNVTKMEVEYYCRSHDMEQKRFLLLSTSIVHMDSPKLVLVTVDDITELKTMERQFHQAQKMEAVGTLAGGIAHDFNNILSAIFGFAELAASCAQNTKETSKYIDQILHAGKRARELVRQILAFSRQDEQEVKPVSVKIIVKEVLKLIRASFPSTIDIRQAVNSHSFVMGDPIRLHQIFMNLCTNAGHAMQAKGGVLEVQLNDIDVDSTFNLPYSDLKPGRYMQIAVSDTGYGISPDLMERIFDPFFTTKKHGEGTGMGLAVVKGIVESHHGAVKVNSEQGKGSMFNIFLPVIDSKLADRISDNETVSGGKEEILYVDDEPSIVEVGRKGLESLGYKVTAVSNPQEAIDIFRSIPDNFDLVLTDMTMPKITGDALARELIAIRNCIPIILCSGLKSDLTEETAEQIGIKGFLMKPFCRSEMDGMIRKVLDENR